MLYDRLVADEELVPFDRNSVDLFLSSLSMHWINDLPEFLRRCYEALRPDGAFLAALFGGDTLFELRSSLVLADLERLGGVATHVSPLTRVPYLLRISCLKKLFAAVQQNHNMKIWNQLKW